MSPSGNILNFPDRSPLEEEAARWVVRHDNGPLSAEERTQFEAWKQANPLHAEAFARLSGHWKDLDVLAALAFLVLGTAAAMAQTGSPAWSLHPLVLMGGPGHAYDVTGEIDSHERIYVDRCSKLWCRVHAGGDDRI